MLSGTALHDLLTLGPRALFQVMRAGHPVELSSLDDTEYHGVALGNPAFIERLTWKTFKKVFLRDPASGLLRGWNVAVEPQGVQGPFVDRRDLHGQRVLYWPYVVHPPGEGVPPETWAACAQIDYGAAHPVFHPQHWVWDPLVALEAGSSELLLGYSRVGPRALSVPTPTFFALLRGGPLTYRAF